jgi:hypothetical protein
MEQSIFASHVLEISFIQVRLGDLLAFTIGASKVTLQEIQLFPHA